MTPSDIAELERRLTSTSIRFNMGYREEPLVNPDGPAALDLIRAQAEALKIATEALEELWGCYQEIANSGDAGFWRAEDTEEGKKAMEALARIKETK